MLICLSIWINRIDKIRLSFYRLTNGRINNKLYLIFLVGWMFAFTACQYFGYFITHSF